MTESDTQKIQTISAELKALVMQHVQKPSTKPSAIDGLNLVRKESANTMERCFEKPLASIILQGHKKLFTGSQEYRMHENQCLVAAVDMPSSSWLLDATHEHPFLALFLYLDRKILSDLVLEMNPESRPVFVKDQCVSVIDAEPELLDAFLRLARLLDKPDQAGILAPLVIRELHYLLLTGASGIILQNLYAHGQNTQILQAITLLRQHITSPLRMDELAMRVNMSISSLHRHFKNITGFSPLQYQKQLRLFEAQRLMIAENERADNAAFAVGYESVTQFNREYKRMFGEPPHRDIQRRRGCVQ